jgi:predicted  nucleic acid-binding Zn-ribbon protein
MQFQPQQQQEQLQQQQEEEQHEQLQQQLQQQQQQQDAELRQLRRQVAALTRERDDLAVDVQQLCLSRYCVGCLL